MKYYVTIYGEQSACHVCVTRKELLVIADDASRL